MSNSHLSDDNSEVDYRQAYLFVNLSTKSSAVTLDRSGSNLPAENGTWILERAFRLGVHEPVPANLDPEPILRALKRSGLFVFSAAHHQPFGTSQ